MRACAALLLIAAPLAIPAAPAAARRRQSQWGGESRGSRESLSNADAEEAAQTFDGLHADDRSTGCGYEGHETTLGPR
jgi:hypothetical protein